MTDSMTNPSIPTLRNAILEATLDHGDDSRWSDGGTTWTIENYADRCAEYGEMMLPAHYDGKRIYLAGDDGMYLSVAALTLVEDEVNP